MKRVLVRYWGSHFKTHRQVGVVVEEFRPIVQRGWQCHLVLEREPQDPDWLIELRSLGVRIHLAPRPSRKYEMRCVTRSMKLCCKLRPDVFVCENIHDSPLLGAALSRVPVRVWIKRSMNSDFERGDRLSLRNRLAPTTRISCALATRVFAVSSAVRDELVGLGVSAEKVLIRLNPRRLGEPKTTKAKSEIRKNLGLSETDVVWASVGHAVPVKGWDMLIRAFHRVVQCDPRAKLLLIGGLDRPEERPTATLLRSDIDRLGLGGNVTLTGHVEDVASLLRASDSFVMASHSEGFSNALVEALEVGLPCVSTRVGIAMDVIHPAVNGLLVDRFDEQAIVAALIELTCNDADRRRLAMNAVVPALIPTLAQYAERMATDFESLRNRTISAARAR